MSEIFTPCARPRSRGLPAGSGVALALLGGLWGLAATGAAVVLTGNAWIALVCYLGIGPLVTLTWAVRLAGVERAPAIIFLRQRGARLLRPQLRSLYRV